MTESRLPANMDERLRRFLADLRGDAERRSRVDRRTEVVGRKGEDRRSGVERRVLADRRSQSYATFVPEDATRINDMVLDPEIKAACPQCHGHLMLGPQISRGSDMLQQVHCTICRRRILL